MGENPLTQAERGNLGFWGTGSGVPFLSVRFFGYAKKGPRRTGVGAPAKAKRPVDPWPGERADHGGSAPVFQAQQESVAQEGEPRTCKREHGERSAASPLVNNRRQAILL